MSACSLKDIAVLTIDLSNAVCHQDNELKEVSIIITER